VNSDLGRPIAYTAIREGTPVHDVTGARVGVVERIVADLDLDIFEGPVVHTTPLPGQPGSPTPTRSPSCGNTVCG